MKKIIGLTLGLLCVAGSVQASTVRTMLVADGDWGQVICDGTWQNVSMQWVGKAVNHAFIHAETDAVQYDAVIFDPINLNMLAHIHEVKGVAGWWSTNGEMTFPIPKAINYVGVGGVCNGGTHMIFYADVDTVE